MSSETLTDADWNRIEYLLHRGEHYRLDETTIYTRHLRALYDLARRAPLPAVDRGQEGAGLLAEGKA